MFVLSLYCWPLINYTLHMMAIHPHTLIWLYFMSLQKDQHHPFTWLYCFSWVSTQTNECSIKQTPNRCENMRVWKDVEMKHIYDRHFFEPQLSLTTHMGATHSCEVLTNKKRPWLLQNYNALNRICDFQNSMVVCRSVKH